MQLKKKLISMMRNPWAAIRRICRYAIYKPRFRQYRWSDNVSDVSAITCRHVILGESVRLGPRCRLQGIARYGCRTFSPTIYLADGVSVEQDLYLTCASRIEIGENTAIAAFVTITDIDHPYADPNLPVERQPITTDSVCIGPDCKIYNGTVILKGTRIGRHCVVGANSVVSGQYPDFSIIAGAPARIVKRYDAVARRWRRTDPKGFFLD